KKSPNERYQNAFGLEYDLEQCVKQLDEQGAIEDFQLGCQDISDRFNIPQKIFGRDEEIKQLMTAFERVSKGSSELVLASGKPGIGKTMLISELHKPIVAQKGYFFSGKYEKLKKNVPYSAIIQAFISLIKQILTESDEQIGTWKKKLLAALGANSQVIIDVIPVLEYIIGKQPPVPELGPEESERRFNVVFKDFIQIFAAKEHPLALFLDDLQWVDQASLNLIKNTITNKDIKYLLIMCAYRDNEVSPSHPFIVILEEIKKAEVTIENINISPLSKDSMVDFIGDFLHATDEKTRDLVELVFEKTQGNPFFINQFVKLLYDDNIIVFNLAKGWQWDIEAAREMDVTDNVIEFMTHKISRLPERTRKILEICSCIGNRFQLEMLTTIMEKNIDEVLDDLTGAIKERFIFYSGETYKFLHDRIQEAAYSLIPNEEKTNLHYRIGKLVLNNTPEDKMDDMIFYIVNHFNSAIHLIKSEDNAIKLAKLNLRASNKAKASAAYESFFNYIKISLDSIGSPLPGGNADGIFAGDAWADHYELTLSIYEAAAEAAYLCTSYREMEILFDIIENKTDNILEKLNIYTIKIKSIISQQKHTEAVTFAIYALSQYGIKLPKKATTMHIMTELVKIKVKLRGKDIEDLSNLPEMTDPNIYAVVNIMLISNSAAYIASPELFVVIVLKVIALSLKYGNMPGSSFAYAGYGIILCSELLEMDTGYKMGQLALKLADKFNAVNIKTRTRFVVHYIINHWSVHIRKGTKHYPEFYQYGIDTGDYEYACYCSLQGTWLNFLSGMELTGVEQEMDKYRKAMIQLEQGVVDFIGITQQGTQNIMGLTNDPVKLIGEIYNEDEMLPVHLERNNRTALSLLGVNWVMLNYYFENYQRAVEFADEYEQYLDGATGLYHVAIFNFYESLARLAFFTESGSKNKKL
ncbi:MAG: AAA family ATPase, partial [Bacteroidetes bacterium]|nr:AAA family ATPase [Bacteroidota bacterium]